MQILTMLPAEIDESTNLRFQEKDHLTKVVLAQGLWVSHVIPCILISLSSAAGNGGIAFALKLLSVWAESCHSTFSQLSNATMKDGKNILQLLVDILSQQQPHDEDIVVLASKVLTSSLLEGSDSGSSTRQQSVLAMLSSLKEGGFMISPFSYFADNHMDDAALSLAILATTFACEEIDLIADCSVNGCSNLIELLLTIQQHHHQPVAISVLEFWLMLQDIPTAQRHPDLTAPLFSKVLNLIAAKIAYPPRFTTWEDELELDSQEFSEMRSLVNDVLVSVYFLLRVNFIDQLCSVANSGQGQWNVTEAILFCICAVAREICARVKAKGTGDIAADRDATMERLLQLVQQLLTGVAQIEHPLTLAAVAKFVGSFSPVWNDRCDLDTILHLLQYLHKAMAVDAAAKSSTTSVKQILNGCSSKIVPVVVLQGEENIETNPIILSLVSLMQSAQLLEDQEGTRCVAEGCTRLCIRFKKPNLIRQSLCSILSPVLQRTQQTFNIICMQGSTLPPAELELAYQSLGSALRVMKEIFRFCDGVAETEAGLTDVLNVTWPRLNEISNSVPCRQHVGVFSELLGVYSQLMSSLGGLMYPHTSQIMTSVVQAFEETYYPCALECVAIAAEAYGNASAESEKSFSQLLGHLSGITCKRLQETGPRNSTQLVSSFFEMTRKYMLYCPGALVGSSEFNVIFSLAVACLVECAGERESTRAAVLFLSLLISLNSINLSPQTAAILKEPGGPLDTALARCGESLTRSCIRGLAGASPQPLWPILADCMFAVVLRTTQSSQPSDHTMAHEWVWHSLADESANERLSDESKQLVMKVLFGLVSTNGPKSKPMVKMLLTDFAKICKGDMSADSLLTYSIK
mmetsp:Transcript_13090/g.19606  ORF Transcript_13090/g.19606 Transcript_13090/m.19606 type:complete len:862 (-) Transcript_13090:432-3017(-)